MGLLTADELNVSSSAKSILRKHVRPCVAAINSHSPTLTIVSVRLRPSGYVHVSTYLQSALGLADVEFDVASGTSQSAIPYFEFNQVCLS